MAKLPSPTAEYLANAIRSSHKTQKAIAKEVGLPRPNALNMMKLGECKVPIDRIPALALACGAPAAPFLKVALEEYHPELLGVLEAFADAFLTADEADWLDVHRARFRRSEVDMDTDLWLATYLFLDGYLARRRS